MAISPLVAGGAAGFVATVPMTLAMELMHERLPVQERYPLPPSEIVTVAEGAAGVDLPPQLHPAATLAAHFGYGAAAGILYGPLVRNVALDPWARGVVFGLGVWTVSYLGLLPSLGVLRPATEHPGRRNALMIAAHVVWGAALGALADRLAGSA
jgi:hypothetical protein